MEYGRSKKSLRKALASGEFITAPGLFDMIAATIANEVEFDFVYASGYWLTASYLGLPDAGIATYSQMLDRVAMLCERSNASVIADADTGYGGLLNLHHTVRGYEQAGVLGIQIEDQLFPKKCGHVGAARVAEFDECVKRVAVACEARRNPEETLIIARTDARRTEGMDGALLRAKGFVEAGADIIFVEALRSKDEMRAACEAIDIPMMANMADGGHSPILSANELKEIGYSLAIFPAITALPAAQAIRQVLEHLKKTGTSKEAPVAFYNFDDFSRMIGFPEVFEFEDRWKT